MFLKYNDSTIAEIVSKTFPNNRKDVKIAEFKGPMNVNSYWDGGTREEYKLYCLKTKKTVSIPESHPYFNRRKSGERMGNIECTNIPKNYALICGGTFCGKPASVRILVHSANLQKLIPDTDSAMLSPECKSALEIICSIKGGYRKDEFERAGLGDYSSANPNVLELAEYGYVKINKAGAVSVTVEGRNARS